jgi:hypothetical protein
MRNIQIQRWDIKAAKDIQAIDFLRWQQLVEQHHAGNIMLSALFVQNLLHTFSDDHYLASCHVADQITIMMVVRKRRLGVWALAQLPQAESALVVGSQQVLPDLHMLTKALPGLVLRLDFFCLDPLDHQGVIEVLSKHSIRSMHQNIRVDCKGIFQSYWTARSKNLRKNISRYENRIESEGKKLRFEFITEPTSVFNAVDAYSILESKGWKGASGTALHPDNAQGKFYRDLLTELAAKNMALIAEFYIDDKLAASRLCCFTPEIFIILKTCYDEQQKPYAPGRLLLAEVIKYAMGNKISATIDFYTHATEEQLEWATESRPMFKGSYYRYPSYFKIKTILQKLKRR